MISLNALITALTGHQTAAQDVRISSAVIDSRQAEEGSLFIALPGERVDGHDYVIAAFDNGATLALVDRPMPADFHLADLRSGYFHPNRLDVLLPLCLRVEDTLSALQTLAAYWRQIHPVLVIGITGSVGKTSTKELTAALLSRRYQVLKNEGNRNNEIGLPLTLLELNDQHECAVLEMGFYVPGEINTLCEIAQPQIGVVTNVGTVHAERAGSQEVIAAGKSELVAALPPDGVAILNLDDPWVHAMAEKTKAHVLTYSAAEAADLTASEIQSHGLAGISCTLTYQDKTHPITSPMLGEFSVYTILRATAVALTVGMDWETITDALAASRVDIRMRPISLPNGITILDDTYNASPESTIAALQLLGGLSGRRVAVLGDMLELGVYEESGHGSVGEAAVSNAEILILVGERSKVTMVAAQEHGFPMDNIQWYADSQAAAQPVAGIIQPGDTVLIKGSNSMHMRVILAAVEESL